MKTPTRLNIIKKYAEKLITEMKKEQFIKEIYKTDLIYNDLDLREFTEEHFQNKASFEENKENFLRFIEVNVIKNRVE